MTPDRRRNFHDPALKEAVRRCWGGEVAPPSLRGRVKRMLSARRGGAAADVRPGAHETWWRARQSWPLAALAAGVVLTVGLLTVRLGAPDGGTVPIAAAAVTAPVPAGLAGKLVRRHDECGHIHPDDHHFVSAAPRDDFGAIARSMSAAAGHPVAAAPIGPDWRFLGASFCPVEGANPAHLVYTKDDMLLSIFSLPASSCPSVGNHATCDASIGDNRLAGFVEGGAFYCVLGSAGSGRAAVDLPQQVRQVRDQLRGQVVARRAGSRVAAPLTLVN